ncbi:DNA-3-methyladenine glycosylase family protein [Nocardia huaxiensis]|uniref:DNA-3-methyladenine glycosylase II n=1 Tax=Nocardia huaxiensis TaxID=2755382 RepID=A0A7D6VFR0_9NOCA|nr:DNA-3-methyladenine glycosylase 2 family protein [Nocardia huaxiensis]QLY34033.1 DNA-3-methyladenine glycosylase 2 family protein [Nocardia huaxiensis]UFT00177.1 DNA-3-methyladenine glycosylase 2 family protein [Nocardia huaxiensis]
MPTASARVRIVRSERPIDLAATVEPLRRGYGDPCHRETPDGGHWHASRMPSGVVTYRLKQVDRCAVEAKAWGPGAEEFLEGLESMLCLDEDLGDFLPEHPKVVEAHRLNPGLRMLRTGLVFEALVPAVLEQKVHTKTAHASWRKLVWKYGTPAPGPAPDGLRVMPDAETWRHIPSWVWHRANVEPQRSRTIVLAARVAPKLEQAAGFSREEAERRVRTVPGIGVWTAAEIAQRAFGDSDALSVGDFHLASIVGWTLLGRPIDDDAMVEYLEPLRPHRYRAVRLLGLAGFAHKPKFGPRTPYTDHSRI